MESSLQVPFVVWPSTVERYVQLPAASSAGIQLSDVRLRICAYMSTHLKIELAPRDIRLYLNQLQLSVDSQWTQGHTITVLSNHCDELFRFLGSKTNIDWTAVGLDEAAVYDYPAYDGVYGGGTLPVSSAFYSPDLMSEVSAGSKIFSEQELLLAFSALSEPAKRRLLEFLRNCGTSGAAWTAMTQDYPTDLLTGKTKPSKNSSRGSRYNGVQPLLRKMWTATQKKLFIRREMALRKLLLQPSLSDFKTVAMSVLITTLRPFLELPCMHPNCSDKACIGFNLVTEQSATHISKSLQQKFQQKLRMADCTELVDTLPNGFQHMEVACTTTEAFLDKMEKDGRELYSWVDEGGALQFAQPTVVQLFTSSMLGGVGASFVEQLCQLFIENFRFQNTGWWKFINVGTGIKGYTNMMEVC